MTFTYNPSGYGRAPTEYELYDLLKETIFMKYDNVKERFEFDRGCIVDYFCKEIFTKKPVIIEVKNWFVTIKDMEQILKYYIHALELYGENKFSLIVYAGGIELDRLKILDKLNIEFHKTVDVVKK
jgi:hypothetical protein